jgi:hypothetical protein
MMKYGLLWCRTSNLGDDIQVLAALQYVPRVDAFLNRDNLSRYRHKGAIAAIMNGWFLHPRYGGMHMQSKSERWLYDRIVARITGRRFDWPPPGNIKPLLVSHHFHYPDLMTSEVVEFYRRNGPVGCRDYKTLDLMRSNDIDAYFSGCLTLTLRPKGVKKSGQVVFVDPFAWDRNYRFPLPGDRNFRNDLWECFPESIRNNALFVTQAHYGVDVSLRQRMAQEMLAIYESARVIVTSRIHCALPCLALGTPVVFLRRDEEDSRFDGIVNLFRTRYSFSELLDGKLNVDWVNPPANSSEFDALASNLRERCTSFVQRLEENAV